MSARAPAGVGRNRAPLKTRQQQEVCRPAKFVSPTNFLLRQQQQQQLIGDDDISHLMFVIIVL